MKKILIIIIFFILGVMLLTISGIACFLFYINTDHSSRLIQSQIGNRIPGSMQWQKLNISLFQGKIEITDFSVSNGDDKILEFDKVFMAFDLPALASKEICINKILIENIEADIRMQENGDLNLMSAFGVKAKEESPEIKEPDQPFVFPFNIKLESLSLVNGNIAYVSVRDDINARLGNLNIKGSVDLIERKAELILNTGRASFKNAGMDAAIEHLSLNGAYLKDALSGFSIDIGSAAGDAKISGSVEKLLSQPVLAIQAEAGLAVEKLMGMLNIQEPVSGRIAIHTDVEGMVNDPKISCRINWDKGEVMSRKIEKALVDIVMENRICDLKSLKIVHGAGALSAKGRILLDRVFPDGFLGAKKNFDEAAWDISIQGNDIQPGIALDAENIKGISGKCSFKTSLSGTMIHPEAALSLTAEGARYMDYPGADIKLNAALKNGNIKIAGLTVQSCDTRLNLSGNVALLGEEGLDLLEDPGLKLNFFSDNINIGNCLKALDLLEGRGIDGDILIQSTIAGTLKKPRIALTMKGTDFSAAGETVSGLDLSARFKDKKLFLDSLMIAVAENQTIQGSGWMGLDKNFGLSLDSDGIKLSSIKQLQKADVADGTASCSISARGHLDNPEVSGTMAFRNFKVMGRSIQDFTADISLKENYASIMGKLGFDINAGFDLKSRDFKADAVFNNTDLLPWLKLAGLSEISGSTTGVIHALGNADTPEKIIATADIGKIALNFPNDLSIESGNINAGTNGETFKIKKFKVRLPENGHISLEADGRINGKINALVDAELPMSLAALFAPDIPPMKGMIGLNARAGIEKDITRSDVNAKISIADVSTILPQNMGRLHGVNGTILADLNSVEITGIQGNLDSGKFSLTGKASLKDFMPEEFKIKLKASAIPVNGVDGLDASLNTDLTIGGNLKTSLVDGNVILAHGEWTKDINVEKEIFSKITDKKRVRKGINQKVSGESFLDTIALNIAIKGKKPFVIDNNMAYMEIHPDIQIQGTAASPVVSGRSEIDPGTIHYQSSDFTMTRGIIDFVNPYAIEPELDIQSERTVRDWNILLAVSGTPDALDFNLSSDPRLDHGDIISLLLRGKTIDELINAEGGTTLSTAGMLSQVAASAVSDNIKSATGLDIFEMGFGNSTSDNGLADLNVTVGKELTEKMTVKYGTESEDGEMVYKTSAEYKIMDNVSLNGFRDSEGQFGGEVRYRLEFR